MKFQYGYQWRPGYERALARHKRCSLAFQLIRWFFHGTSILEFCKPFNKVGCTLLAKDIGRALSWINVMHVPRALSRKALFSPSFRVTSNLMRYTDLETGETRSLLGYREEGGRTVLCKLPEGREKNSPRAAASGITVTLSIVLPLTARGSKISRWVRRICQRQLPTRPHSSVPPRR